MTGTSTGAYEPIPRQVPLLVTTTYEQVVWLSLPEDESPEEFAAAWQEEPDEMFDQVSPERADNVRIEITYAPDDVLVQRSGGSIGPTFASGSLSRAIKDEVSGDCHLLADLVPCGPGRAGDPVEVHLRGADPGANGGLVHRARPGTARAVRRNSGCVVLLGGRDRPGGGLVNACLCEKERWGRCICGSDERVQTLAQGADERRKVPGVPDDLTALAGRSGQATRSLRPRLDVGPCPGGTASHGPARLGQQPSGAPDVDGGALDAEALGDLGDADGVAAHEVTVANLLTTDQDCSDTHYMTESSKTTEHTITIDGFRYQGEGTYTVRCTCGATFEGIAYHADAKRLGAAHVAQAKAAVL